jgi:hypothetical protein
MARWYRTHITDKLPFATRVTRVDGNVNYLFVLNKLIAGEFPADNGGE